MVELGGVVKAAGGNMTSYISAILILTAVVLFCIIRSYRSSKEISGSVRIVLAMLLIPVSANMVIATAEHPAVNHIAYIFYLVGTNCILAALVRYSLEYCDMEFPLAEKLSYIVLSIDSILVCLNPVLHHVFRLQRISLRDKPVYYILDSNWYHFVHLGISFFVIIGLIAIFIARIYRTSKLYMERYIVILFVFVLDVIWEFYNVFTRTPYNMSMIGFLGCGILIYFFSVRYHHFLLTHQMFNKVFAHFSNSAFFFDDHFKCLYMNPTSLKMFNIDKDDYSRPTNYIKEFLESHNISGKGNYITTQKLEREDGQHIYQVEYRPLYDKRGMFMGAYVLLQDRTEEEKKAAEARYLATHDRLTGLLNMDAFFEQVVKRLKDDQDNEYLMMASNIREFKLINDIFGRAEGDKLLNKVARLMEKLAGPDEIYARIAADKFVMLLPKAKYDSDSEKRMASEALFLEENREYPVVNHVGIYEITDRNMPVPAMIDRAFMAISSIRDNIVQRSAWYEDKMRESVIWEQMVTGSLDDAMESGQIVPYLQAQVDSDGKVEGAEVLVRWNHPTEGLMAPGRFIEILENNGRIVNLDRFMWEETCKILKRWKDMGRDDLYLSVNISP